MSDVKEYHKYCVKNSLYSESKFLPLKSANVGRLKRLMLISVGVIKAPRETCKLRLLHIKTPQITHMSITSKLHDSFR